MTAAGAADSHFAVALGDSLHSGQPASDWYVQPVWEASGLRVPIAAYLLQGYA